MKDKYISNYKKQGLLYNNAKIVIVDKVEFGDNRK